MALYDFDEIIERRGTDCVKYDRLEELYGRNDLIPMWVADMDFRSPDFVMEAIRRRCRHEVLGYAIASDGYYKAVIGWLLRRYGIAASRDGLHFIPGIVAGISFALQALTAPGDRVLVTTPVYPPFLNLPAGAGRRLECCPLSVSNGRFAFDFDRFEQQAAGCKMLILSNPHNPGGTVWSPDDLRRVADICHRHGLVVIADEIHADLTLPGFSHASFSTVSEVARRISLTFMAPSKTFNIAGLGSSVCYVAADAEVGGFPLRDRYFGWLDRAEVAGGNIFAFVGAEAAFAHGEEWLRQLLDYLAANVGVLRRFLAAELPEVRAVLPEASYLAWLDFGAYGLPHSAMRDLLVNDARVALNDGTTFGGPSADPSLAGRAESYEHHFRLNIGCPRAVLEEALARIATALKKRLQA